MSTSAPVKEVYDIPIVKPTKVPEEPQRLNPGVPTPIIVKPIVVPERVRV